MPLVQNSHSLSLKQLQELHSSILSAIPHAVVGLQDRTIFFANEAVERVFGWTPDEIIGQKTRLLYRSDQDYEEIGRRFYPLLEKRKTHMADFPCVRKDGREIICRISASVIGKELIDKGIVVMYEDITDLKKAKEDLERYRDHLEEFVKERTQQLDAVNKEFKKANEKLQELDRLKSLFIASMSHELRTPLNSIIGFTGMTLKGLSGELNEEQKDNLSRAYQSARHLLALISDVIDISKIEAGRVDIFPEEISLKELVEESARIIEPQLKDKNLRLTVYMPMDIRINTDRRRLLQCLINILSNAVKYTEKGGITVAVIGSNHNVEISVVDTGIGIPRKDMPKLFEPFERLYTPLRVKSGGTGLGLYLTKKIAVDILGGSVSVQSEEGKGSTFTLRVPRDLKMKSNRSEAGDEK